jgi:predicted RNase H-like HicB family nuclease
LTEHTIIYEQAGDGSWSARPAELPVYAAGDTREEAERHVREGIAVHLDALRERGEATSPSAPLSSARDRSSRR